MNLFKVSITHADLFISHLDLSGKTIAYSVRDKETGILLEPHFKSRLEINESQIMFDSRYIGLGFAKHIETTLNS